MSFVGPRPWPLEPYYDELERGILRKKLIRPGLTGLVQASKGNPDAREVVRCASGPSTQERLHRSVGLHGHRRPGLESWFALMSTGATAASSGSEQHHPDPMPRHAPGSHHQADRLPAHTGPLFSAWPPSSVPASGSPRTRRPLPLHGAAKRGPGLLPSKSPTQRLKSAFVQSPRVRMTAAGEGPVSGVWQVLNGKTARRAT